MKILDKIDAEISTRSTCSSAYDGFVGSSACKSCHADRHLVWEKSHHAKAMEPLRKLGKHQNAGCYSCHVTSDRTRCEDSLPVPAPPALASVGCESCHGPGGDHVQGRGRMQTITGSATCRTCHIGRFGRLGRDEWKWICRGK